MALPNLETSITWTTLDAALECVRIYSPRRFENQAKPLLKDLSSDRSEGEGDGQNFALIAEEEIECCFMDTHTQLLLQMTTPWSPCLASR